MNHDIKITIIKIIINNLKYLILILNNVIQRK